MSNEIEHEGKKYILKSAVESIVKERVSKVAAKASEMERIAHEHVATIENLRESQGQYDVLNQQVEELTNKLSKSKNKFSTYQNISKYGITDPELIDAIEYQYDRSMKNVDKDQILQLDEWLSKQIEHPDSSPSPIRPHLKALIPQKETIQQQNNPAPQIKENSEIKTQETKTIINTNNGAVRAPDGETVLTKSFQSQEYYNQNHEKAMAEYMAKYARNGRR